MRPLELQIDQRSMLIELSGERATRLDPRERIDRPGVAAFRQQPGFDERRQEAGIDRSLTGAQDFHGLLTAASAKLVGDEQHPEIERGLGDRHRAAELQRQGHVAGGDGADHRAAPQA